MSTIGTAKQAFEQAIQEQRQPNCPYCQKPLEVEQVQTEYIRWVWNHERKRYEKDDDDGHADDPCCANCGNSDADFLRSSSRVYDLCERLGLDY